LRRADLAEARREGRLRPLPQGGEDLRIAGRRDEFEITELLDSVAVLALTPSSDVILVEEFRPGPQRVLFELPGGVVERAQAPSDAARAELLEKTGYEGELIEIGALLSDAYATRVKHVFAATACRAVSEPEALNSPRLCSCGQ
jgi:ADP-ribose pyrophosphatase